MDVVENAVLTLLHSGYSSGPTEIKSNTQHNLLYRISGLWNLSTKKWELTKSCKIYLQSLRENISTSYFLAYPEDQEAQSSRKTNKGLET